VRPACSSTLSSIKLNRMLCVYRMTRDARAALLASKRTIDSQSLSQREELFRSSAAREKGPDANEKVTYVHPSKHLSCARLMIGFWCREDALMKATNDVTEALRRTLGLMQGELERSVLSSQMLGCLQLSVICIVY
jgi:protein transport protein SEC20